MTFHAYLFFSNGQCAEAFDRYRDIFGGELQVMTFADGPEGGEPMPGAEPGHVMHASLTVGEGLAAAEGLGLEGGRFGGGGISISPMSPNSESQ